MSRLHLLILWLLAIGAGFFFLKSKGDPSASAAKTKLETGSPVLAANLVDTIDGFKIEKDGETVTLKKADGNWLVSEQGDFPASLGTVTRMLDALRDTKVSQGVSASDEYYDRFNLDPSVENEDERPETITLMTEGKEGDKIYLGKSRESTGGAGKTAGRFVRLSNDDSGVYIVQQTFASIDANSSNWIDKSLSLLEEGAIRIEVSAPKDEGFKTWAISRKSVIDDFLVEGISDKEETKTNTTGTLKNIFSRATFLELLEAEDAKKRMDEKATRELKATDSAGSIFLVTFAPEKKEEKKEDEKTPDQAAPMAAENYVVSVKILNGPTKPETPAADANTQEKAVFEQRVANLADLSAKVNRMREKIEGRYFLVNKATIGSLLKSRGEFIQAKKVERPKTSVATKPIPVPSPDSSPPTKPRMAFPGKTPPPSIARPKENKTAKPKVEAVTPPVQAPPKVKKSEGPKTPPLPGSRPE